MGRRLKQSAAVFVVVLVAAQFFRPDRTNPPTDVTRTIQAHEATAPALVSVLERSCRDCHSNRTVWPWYTEIAPASWLMAQAVREGRKAVNFSEWGAYSPQQQGMLLSVSCDAVRSGTMPGPYMLLRPETRLSSVDIATICAAARRP